MAKNISVHIKSVFVRLEQFTDFRKSLKNHDLTVEVDTPMGPNHKTEETRLRSQKWAELC